MRLYKAIAAGVLTVTAAAASVVALPALTETADAASGPGVTANLWHWNWNSVARECTEVLGPAGYGSVQVSPPADSMSKGGSVWWDVYQPARYVLTSKFGDETAFRNMVAACHSAGVKVQVDAVVNHMTGQGSTSYGGYSFSKYDYPGFYAPWDFHSPTCAIDDADYVNNAWRVQNCELVGLADLNTGSDYVRGQIAAYLNKLTDLGVDGFRIDAAKHISPDDIAAIKSRLKGSPYIHQEVIYGDNEAVQPSWYTGNGDVDEFVYGRKLKEQFTGQIKWLQSFGQSWGLSVGSDKAMVFVDNHDTERNGSTLNYKYGATYKLANVFMLAWPYGKPSVYSSFTWGDSESGPPSANGGFVTDSNCSNGRWTCFHREMSGMVGFYNAVQGTSVANWTDNGNNLIAFSRGNKGWVAINNENSSVTRTFTTGLPAGTYPNVAGGGSVTVNSNGTATVTVPAKSAVAIRVGTSASPSPTGNSATVYYYTGWNPAYIHYGINGSWTTVPGVAMDTACTGWKKKTIDLGTATSFQVTFNNGSGSWDNNQGRDYTIGTGTSTVKNGVVTGNAPNPCG
ncbi:alpha-amylase [Microbispora rosea subsp. aerata]|nr:carbohydrate binding domain-containing protein [Microbispora rosea]GGO27634.1 alpha-amylase [Microbispora rosea subsp. aerata]GIH58560.1 alpha-amylase [Microbispora rosea subsp. aerata]GLJ85301.1 alpha-amylase [Microbispora rosea subsp. aerata]